MESQQGRIADWNWALQVQDSLRDHRDWHPGPGPDVDSHENELHTPHVRATQARSDGTPVTERVAASGRILRFYQVQAA